MIRTLLLLLCGLLPGVVSAQHLVASFGMASVQGINSDQANPSAGLGIELPLAPRVSASVQYQYWSGENHVLREMREGVGWAEGEITCNNNHAFSALLAYDVVRWKALGAAVEAGASAYRVSRVQGVTGTGALSEKKRYIGALDFGGLLKLQATPRIDVRTEVRFGFDGLDELRSRSSDWVFARFGLGYRL